MRNTNKKGFTIVELVIVVAVIAILAAVMIPTFAGIIDRANQSKDTQLIKNLNTALAADVDGDKTMAGALAAAAEFGYDIEKINAKASDSEILWDSVNNVFCYLNNGEIEYLGDVANKGTGADLWIIADDVHDTYSTYLVNYEGTSVDAKHGLDVSACGAVDVTYAGSAEVDIFTNGGDITVKGGTVNHYGAARYLDKVAGTYNEFGTVVADLANVEILPEASIPSEWTKVNSASTLKDALAAKAPKIMLTADITIEDEVTAQTLTLFTVNADTEINLNGHNITAVRTIPHSISENIVLINVASGNLTLSGCGVISLGHPAGSSNMGWNKLSSTLRIAGGSSSITINDAVIVEHTGGTDMAYAIDVYASSNAATVTMNGGALYSSYTAIRFFFPSATTTGSVNINAGALFGDSRDIWVQGNDGTDFAKYVKVANGYKVTTNAAGDRFYID